MYNKRNEEEYMLFSIIMPAYNAEKFIEFSIKSVLAQTVSSWELIIVDDGSYDNTVNICKKYSEKDSRIKIVRCKNSGVSNARNIGISYAIGEYIVFLDSDDSLMESCIEIYQRLIKESCQDIIISNYYTQTRCIKKARKIDAQVISSKEKIEELFEMALRQSQYHGEKWFGNLHSVWGKCFKKSIIKANSLKFDTNLSIGEDLLFFVSYIKYCSGTVLTDEVTYCYRINEDSIMHSTTWKGSQMGVRLFNEITLMTKGIVSNKALLDLWTEISENNWECIHRSKLSFREKYLAFKELMNQRPYMLFSDGTIVEYGSIKQKIYDRLIRCKCPFVLMMITYFRIKKNNLAKV